MAVEQIEQPADHVADLADVQIEGDHVVGQALKERFEKGGIGALECAADPFLGAAVVEQTHIVGALFVLHAEIAQKSGDIVDLAAVDRLEDVIARVILQRDLRGGEVLIGAQEDERHVGHGFINAAAERRAVHDRHDDVADDEIGRALDGQIVALLPVGGRGDQRAADFLPGDELRKTIDDAPVVIDDHDLEHGRSLQNKN